MERSKTIVSQGVQMCSLVRGQLGHPRDIDGLEGGDRTLFGRSDSFL